MEIEGAVLDIDYLLNSSGGADIRLTIKGTDGKAYEMFDPEFKPYFYLLPTSKMEINELMAVSAMDGGGAVRPASIEPSKRKILGKDEDTFKIFAPSPIYVPKLSAAMSRYGTCYEYDIPFAKRYTLDKDITPLSNYEIKADGEGGRLCIKSMKPAKNALAVEFNLMCFDIEVYNPLGVPRPSNDPVIMISYTYRSKGESGEGVITFKKIKKDFVTVVGDERELFAAFADKVRELDIDVIVGYNSANFDIRYMIERARRLGVKFNLSRYEGETRLESHGLVQRVKMGGVVHVDMYQIVKFISIVGASESILKLNSYTLKNVYEAISEDKKTTVDKMNIYKLWDGTSKELEELAGYNLKRFSLAADGLRHVHSYSRGAVEDDRRCAERRLCLDNRAASRLSLHAVCEPCERDGTEQAERERDKEQADEPDRGRVRKDSRARHLRQPCDIRLPGPVSIDNNIIQHRPVIDML